MNAIVTVIVEIAIIYVVKSAGAICRLNVESRDFVCLIANLQK